MRVEGPVKVDTKQFAPQISASFSPTRREPENPELPWAIPPGQGNTLPLGGMLSDSRGNAGAFFPGISATGWYPADPTIAVGPNNVVETVNASLAFFSKTGTLQLQQAAQTFYASLGATSFQFDPRVVYDRLSQRWVIAYDEEQDSPQVSKMLVGVSATSDPNGSWYLYRIEAKLTTGGSTYWLDYPSLGYNKDAYVLCGNMFGFSGGSAGIQFIVLPKASMLTGGSVTASYLRDTGAFSAQIADNFDSTSTTVYGTAALTTTSLRIYGITGVTGTPTLNFTSVTVPSFSGPTSPAPSKPGTLDTIDARVFSATWRSGHLFASHNVSVGGVNHVRWYDVNLNNYPTSSPSLFQSGDIIAGGSAQYHMGAVGSNGYNDISAIFTRSSTTIPADAMYSGRLSTDPAGNMGAPVLLESSAGSSYGGAGTNRWGDYFRCVVDPTDDTTFWGVTMTGTASGDWRADIYSWTITAPASLSSVSAPATIQGTQSGTGTVTLDHAAPQYGYVVALSSSNPSKASVPASVTVPGGSTSVNFTITTAGVTSDTAVTITASLRGVNKTANTTVLAPRLQGSVTLGDWIASEAGQQVTVEVRSPGSTTALDTYNATLDASGHFAVVTSRVGTFDVAIKASHWLRKVVANATFNAIGSNVTATLINGDINGDNAVTLGDFAAFRLAYNSSPGDPNWNPNADLNGSGAVTLGDFAILRSHFNANGDH